MHPAKLTIMLSVLAVATLIAAARTQQKFDEFENCVQKARKARDIIARQN